MVEGSGVPKLKQALNFIQKKTLKPNIACGNNVCLYAFARWQ